MSVSRYKMSGTRTLGVPAPTDVFIKFQATGCKISEKRIIDSVHPMVIKIASKFIKRAEMVGLELDDLVQEGCIGVMRAAKLFKPELGFKFSTYSYLAIQQHVLRSIDNAHWATKSARKAGNCRHMFSLDSFMVEDGSDRSITNQIADRSAKSDPEYSMDQMLSMIVDDRDREIVKLRFCDGLTLEETGKVIGLTKERIRQIEKRGMEAIRFAMMLRSRQHLRINTKCATMREVNSQIVITADVPNANGRVYSKQVLSKMVEDFNNLPKRSMFGQIEPDGGKVVLLSDASHVVDELRLADGKLIADISILDTPSGKELSNALNLRRIAFRPRGTGSGELIDGVFHIDDDYKLLSIDAYPTNKGNGVI